MKRYVIIMLCIITSTLFAQDGKKLFDDSFVHKIEINSSQDNIYDLLYEDHENYLFNNGQKIYREVKIIIDGKELDSNVGVRFKGETSFSQTLGQKKPIKIDINKFNDDQKYDDLKKFNLHNARSDPSMIRDKIAYDIMREQGIAAPRVSFARVYLNDQYWGLYSIVEQIDKTFLKYYFKDKKGNLYKSPTTSQFLTWNITGQPQTSADTMSLVNGMLLKTNEKNPKYNRFVTFLDAINNSTDDEFMQRIESQFELDQFLTVLAVDLMLLDVDKYWQAGKNYYMYENTLTNKTVWIPWDYNLCMNYIFDNVPDYVGYKKIIDNPKFENSPLVSRILSNSILRAKYLNKVCQILNSSLNTVSLYGKLDKLKALISDHVYEDQKKDCTNKDFDEAYGNGSYYDISLPNKILGLKSFWNKRSEYIQEILDANNIECSTRTEDLINEKRFQITVFPNPNSSGRLHISKRKENCKVILMNSLGITLKLWDLKPTDEYIPLMELPNGIYLLKFETDLYQITQRLIIN
ncbi:MAG: CotH kinase family protein [Hyphomicrobiales bacterium]